MSYLCLSTKALQVDVELKVAVGHLKAKFMDSTEALIHGDLHSGSVMVKEGEKQRSVVQQITFLNSLLLRLLLSGSTFIIDPEFAIYGPMGFELGAIIANFFLNCLSQEGHQNGQAYARWVLDQVGSKGNKARCPCGGALC